MLVHFFFMSVSCRLGLSPPKHLSPGIFRYLEMGRGDLVTPQLLPRDCRPRTKAMGQDLSPLGVG